MHDNCVTHLSAKQSQANSHFQNTFKMCKKQLMTLKNLIISFTYLTDITVDVEATAWFIRDTMITTVDFYFYSNVKVTI